MGDGMSFETTGFDDILKELNGLANSGDVADEMLKAAAPVLEKELKKQVNIGANRGYVSEGHELENSIKANAPKENSHGHFVSITAKGKNKKGTRYNEILAYLTMALPGRRPEMLFRRQTKKLKKNVSKRCRTNLMN